MKKVIIFIVVIAVVVIGILVAGPFFVIEEGEQAVVVQMGRIVRVVTNAGLHMKTPFIDDIVRYPKRIMAWDGEQKSIPTREKQYIWVDVTARWRINDPQKFYESIYSIDRAYSKLAEVIDSEVKTVTAENYFRESVRNSNIIMDRVGSVDDLGIGDEIDPSLIQSSIKPDTSYEPIEKGRRGIAEEVLNRSRRMVPEYGRANRRRNAADSLLRRPDAERVRPHDKGAQPNRHGNPLRRRGKKSSPYGKDGQREDGHPFRGLQPLRSDQRRGGRGGGENLRRRLQPRQRLL